MTVKENVSYFLDEQSSLSRKEKDICVGETLKEVNLEGVEDYFPEQLSGGMKKRVAIARSLIFEPEILLYDEPTAGLDPINAKSILDLIQNLKKKCTTSVIVTHIMHDVLTLGDKIILINNGKVEENGTIHEVIKSENKLTKDFFFELYQDAEIAKLEKLI